MVNGQRSTGGPWPPRPCSKAHSALRLKGSISTGTDRGQETPWRLDAARRRAARDVEVDGCWTGEPHVPSRHIDTQSLVQGVEVDPEVVLFLLRDKHQASREKPCSFQKKVVSCCLLVDQAPRLVPAVLSQVILQVSSAPGPTMGLFSRFVRPWCEVYTPERITVPWISPTFWYSDVVFYLHDSLRSASLPATKTSKTGAAHRNTTG